MEEKNITGLVPENVEGKAITAEASIHLTNKEEASELYNQAKDKLLHVQQWGKLAGALSANFQLTDNNGKVVDRHVTKGDHFKVDITGPGSKVGESYDWVLVEDVKEVNEKNTDSIAITVRPSKNPEADNKNIAHFYSERSTSTFVITREENTVTASIYDRNIEPNSETKDPIDKIRNTIIGLSAEYGFSKLQWQALANALIKKS